MFNFRKKHRLIIDFDEEFIDVKFSKGSADISGITNFIIRSKVDLFNLIETAIEQKLSDDDLSSLLLDIQKVANFIESKSTKNSVVHPLNVLSNIYGKIN